MKLFQHHVSSTLIAAVFVIGALLCFSSAVSNVGLRLFNGSIYTIGHVMHAQGKKIRIESSPEIPLEVDGELLGETPVTISVLHREVRVIVNKSFLDKIK